MVQDSSAGWPGSKVAPARHGRGLTLELCNRRTVRSSMYKDMRLEDDVSQPDDLRPTLDR